jgi:hypothetical protein
MARFIPENYFLLPSYNSHASVNIVHRQPWSRMEAGMSGRQPAGADALTPWFNPPDDGRSGRRALTRERAAAEALTVIDADGARPLSMRAVAARPACSTTGEQLRADRRRI